MYNYFCKKNVNNDAVKKSRSIYKKYRRRVLQSSDLFINKKVTTNDDKYYLQY